METKQARTEKEGRKHNFEKDGEEIPSMWDIQGDGIDKQTRSTYQRPFRPK